MENYKEKINRGTDKHPHMVDRLIVIKAMYGYNLYDRKIRKPLLTRQTQKNCEKGLKLLHKDKIDEFNALKEKLANSEVNVNKIIVFKSKYQNEFYNINNYQQLCRVALRVLEIRLNSWYIKKMNEPEPLDFTHADLDKMPKSFLSDATRKLEDYKRRMKVVTENNNLYESAVNAVKEKNGDAAWSILNLRVKHEYEEYEIIEPHNL